jgi:3-hydroxypropanoate dehydrogenase
MTQIASLEVDLSALDSELSPLALDDYAQELLFRSARTANTFSSQPVTDQQLAAIYELAKWGPTAMNSQPLRIVAIRTPEARERVVAHLAGGNKARTAAAPLTVVLAADYDFHENLDKTFPVFPGARDLFAEKDSRVETATFNAALQMGYFIVAARSAGLGVGPMTGFDADGLSQELFPDGRLRALMVVNLGYPAENAFRPRQPRLDYDEAVTTI